MSIPSISTLWVTAILVTQLAVKPPTYLLAQVTSGTTTTPKSVAKTLTIDSAQVIYVSGDVASGLAQPRAIRAALNGDPFRGEQLGERGTRVSDSVWFLQADIQ